MNNPRSASNAWAVIKKKLAEGATFPASDQPKTPRKAPGSSRKATATAAAAAAAAAAAPTTKPVKSESQSESELSEPETTPKKTPRKRAAKSKVDASGSPKKRGRKTKAESIKEEGENFARKDCVFPLDSWSQLCGTLTPRPTSQMHPHPCLRCRPPARHLRSSRFLHWRPMPTATRTRPKA